MAAVGVCLIDSHAIRERLQEQSLQLCEGSELLLEKDTWKYFSDPQLGLA